MPNKTKINLLQQDLVVATRFRHLTRISLFLVLVYAFIIVGLFLALFLFSRQRAGLESVSSNLIRDIQGLKETEGLLVTLKNRLALSKSIFAVAAPAPAELIEKQIKSLPDAVEVNSLIAKEDGTLTLALRAQKSAGIKNFLQSLKEQNPVSVVLNSLILLEDGTYSISVNIK